MPDPRAVADAAHLVNEMKPIDRLRKQPVNLVGALSWLTQYDVPYVVTGAAAGLLQGYPTPAHELREFVARSWAFNESEVHVTLVAELPPSISVELLSDFAVKVLPPYELLEDEEVASMLGVTKMRSSET
jgi:hypothetical protein